MSNKSEAFLAGELAWENYIFTCPYPKGSVQWVDWEDGWCSRHAEYVESKKSGGVV